MALKYNLKYGSCSNSSGCPDKYGCPSGVCPDFIIRRHDTRPSFKVAIENCDGPMDFRGLVVEVNMWANAKLKSNITENDNYFRLADDIGFNQIMVGDIIHVDQVRLPEKMLVIGFDEKNKLVQVVRGYHGTLTSSWEKGTILRIFRINSAPAQAEIVFDDIQNVDGTITKDVIKESSLLYEWNAADTCLPGCYWLEFKVLKMIDIVWYLPGGYWKGNTFNDTDGFYNTGSSNTDASVKLSYDQNNEKYILPSIVWEGEIHLHIDGNFYTGSVHSDGSVILKKSNFPIDNNIAYNESGVIALSTPSVIPSFTDNSLTPEDFGCVLGEGVEWVRRFPIDSEGYLIKIEFSPTSEI